MSRQVFCDNCYGKFKPKVRTKRLPRGVEHTFFACPECAEVYDVSYTNKPIRKLHERLRNTRVALGNETNPERVSELQRQAEEMTNESRKLMIELKKQFNA